MKAVENDGATLFETIPLDENQQSAARVVDSGAAELFKTFCEIRDIKCRDRAIEHLEIAVMFAKKGIARGR